MTNSFLVLVSSAGVELLAAETPTQLRFFSRRCQRSGGRLACYWALLPAGRADSISRLVQLGFRREAQRHLVEATLDAGPVAPFEDFPLDEQPLGVA